MDLDPALFALVLQVEFELVLGQEFLRFPFGLTDQDFFLEGCHADQGVGQNVFIQAGDLQ